MSYFLKDNFLKDNFLKRFNVVKCKHLDLLLEKEAQHRVSLPPCGVSQT